jgi:membrane peptidoglycan carboxypeptidase
MTMADVPAPQPRFPRFRPVRLAGLVGSRFVVFVALITALALLATLVVLPLVVPAGAFVRNTSAQLGQVPPLAEALPKPAARSVIYAADRKTQLATLFGDENRKVVKLHDMGMRIRRAVIAIEDYRFYEHEGIDYRGIARAVVEDVREGNIRQGGSTLTQQYIKNVLTGNAKTLDRKIREAIYAVQLEKRLGKNEILEAYLNQAYFGEGAYGVAAAAEHYFSKPVNKLSFPEAAALAATIAAPERYRPTNEAENGPRRKLVLDRMLQLGYATQREVYLAKRERPKIRIKKLSARQPYFVEFIKHQLLHDPAYDSSLGPADTSARRKAVFEGGLSIYTTLQPGPQSAAEKAVRDRLAGKAPDGALASVEPNTGKIIAMVSGKNFRENQVNLAVLGQGGTGYHSGSTFKVFYLVSALEQGLKPSLTFNAPPQMTINDPSCPEGWEVGNAEPTEGGNFNMYTGVQHSVNTYFAQLMTKVRPRNAVETARRMGIQVAKPDTRAYANNWNICSSVLGTGNISVLDMASAFGVLANDGVRCQPYSITEVRDRDGKMLLAPRKSSCERVVPQGVSRQVVDMLRTVIQGGTGWRAALGGRPLAGKTGTAQDYTSAMFTGFTPQLATSVWVGHRSGLVSMRHEYDGQRVFGGTFPAEIFHDFMLAALDGKRAMDFPPPPEGRPKAPTGDKVPGVVGRPLAQARSILTKAGFRVSVTQVDNNAPKNVVIGQSPAGGARAAKGTTVTLQVSKGGGGGGQGDATVPGVVGQRQSDAAAAIRHAGLKPQVVYAIARGGDVGRVMQQSPGGGSHVSRGSTVILVVGRRIGF